MTEAQTRSPVQSRDGAQGRERVFGLCGSLRARSSNQAALEAIALLGSADFDMTIYDQLREIPAFDPDLEPNPPAIITQLRALVSSCSWMVISSPEYAHGIAGSLKNLLDWLVGSETFSGIKVAVINASPRAHHANEQLREVLRTMAAVIVDEASVEIPLTGRNLAADEILADPALRRVIATCVHRAGSTSRNSGEDTW